MYSGRYPFGLFRKSCVAELRIPWLLEIVHAEAGITRREPPATPGPVSPVGRLGRGRSPCRSRVQFGPTPHGRGWRMMGATSRSVAIFTITAKRTCRYVSGNRRTPDGQFTDIWLIWPISSRRVTSPLGLAGAGVLRG